jgi:hypothetical protein
MYNFFATTLFIMIATSLLALSSFLVGADAVSKKQWSKRGDYLYLPKEVNDYKIATAPNNVTIRYKNPGICETTPGVDSYSGYVDLTPDVCYTYTPSRTRLRKSVSSLISSLGSRVLLVLRVPQQPLQRPVYALAQWRTWLRLPDRAVRGKRAVYDR